MTVAWRRNLITLGLLAGVSVAFSWPLVLAPTTTVVTRQLDAFGMVWLASQAHHLSLAFRSDAVAWPVGQDLGWCDSYLVLVLVRLFGLARHPVLALALTTLLGPVLSGWAAERVSAWLLGVRWPWTLVAGFGYGFSGVMVTTLLEGHLYALMNPWLPLLAWSWARALGDRGRGWHGLVAGAMWVFSLLTTAYAGVAGALLVLGLAVFLLRPGRTRLTPLVCAACVAAPAGMAYAHAMLGVAPVTAQDGLDHGAGAAHLEAGAATLASLTGWFPGIDEFFHSMGPAIGWTTLLLAAVAPLALRPGRLWLSLWITSLAALGLALGPRIGPLFRSDLIWVWTPWSLIDTSKLGGFRFPCRLMLLSSFGLAVVGAMVVDAIARVRPRIASLLLPALLVDLFVVQRVGARSGVVPLVPPTAYAAVPAEGAVLDLLPTSLGEESAMYVRSLAQGYQVAHGRPVVLAWGSDGQRMRAGFTRAPGLLLEQAFDALIFADVCPPIMSVTRPVEAWRVNAWLASLGIGAVVVRPTLWPSAERTRVLSQLVWSLGNPVANTLDAGEWVLVFRVQGTPASASAAAVAWERWSRKWVGRSLELPEAPDDEPGSADPPGPHR